MGTLTSIFMYNNNYILTDQGNNYYVRETMTMMMLTITTCDCVCSLALMPSEPKKRKPEWTRAHLAFSVKIACRVNVTQISK